MILFIITPQNGKVLRLAGEPSDTVAQLKQQISTEEGIPSEQQNLFLWGKELLNNKTLERSDIQDGSSLVLCTSLGNVFQSVQISYYYYYFYRSKLQNSFEDKDVFRN